MAGITRRCWLHVPTLLFLDVHIIVRVFNEGSGSRWYLRRQVTSSVALMADSVTQELNTCDFVIANNLKDSKKKLIFCLPVCYTKI